jgi:dihydroorotase
MITLQTAFAMVMEAIPDLNATLISRIFSGNARNIFRLPATNIAVGAKANLTMFSLNSSTTLTTANNLSRSANSAILNRTLKGKVIGTIRNTFYHFNP